MTHNLNLNPEPFLMIKSGKKTIEMRLWDEKRQLINIGDTIIFKNTEDASETLTVEVLALHRFASFKELYEKLPLLSCGYTEDNITSASYKDMEYFYPPEKQQCYGVVGIEIKLI